MGKKKKKKVPLFRTGSSDDGSPVLDEKGRLVGMVIAISGSDKLVFCKVKNIEKALKEKKSVVEIEMHEST